MVRIVVLTLIFALASCAFFYDANQPNLSMTGENNISGKIRLDGFYYSKTGEYINSITFFYANGVVYDCRGSLKSIEDAKKYIKTEFLNRDEYKSDRAGWGVYKIVGDSIWIESWYSKQQGRKKTIITSGSILRKKELNLTFEEKFKKGIKVFEEKINRIYFFEEFNEKPDSTNKFIK